MNYILLAWLIFFCKSPMFLLEEWRKFVNLVEPEVIIDYVEHSIVESNLHNDDFVRSTWMSRSRTQWAERLRENRELFRAIVRAEVRIHVSRAQPWADWLAIIERYEYELARQ